MWEASCAADCADIDLQMQHYGFMQRPLVVFYKIGHFYYIAARVSQLCKQVGSGHTWKCFFFSLLL